MNIKQRLETALHNTPESKKEERNILNQLNDVMSFRKDSTLPDTVILTSRMTSSSVTAFFDKTLGVNVQNVVFLPFAMGTGEIRYQVQLN